MSKPSVKFSNNTLVEEIEDEDELTQLMDDTNYQYLQESATDLVPRTPSVATVAQRQSTATVEPTSDSPRVSRLSSRRKSSQTSQNSQSSQSSQGLQLHTLASDSWYTVKDEWERELEADTSIQSMESELDKQLPVIEEEIASDKLMTLAEFYESMRALIELPTLSQLTLTPELALETEEIPLTEQQMDFTKHPTITVPSEEQSEESGSYAFSSAETDSALHVSDDEELLEMIEEIDMRNQQLVEEVARTTSFQTADHDEIDDFMQIANEFAAANAQRTSEERRLEDELRKVKFVIADFLNHLIERATHASQMDDPLAQLRKRLDKNKLLEKLLELVIFSHDAQRINKLLNKKTADHFRHKKAMKNLMQHYQSPSAVELEKFQNNLDNLDIYLGYEKAVLDNKLTLEQNLNLKIDKLSNAVQNEIEYFEELVRRSLCRQESSERHVTTIDLMLNSLSKARQEVTDFRRELIMKQSQIAHLKKELDALEKIDDGLYLNDYNLQLTETIGLGKLVEDKDFQIQNTRKRCHDALHTVTHMLENISTEKSLLYIQEDDLDDVEEQKQKLREKLYHLKLQHLLMLQENMQIHKEGGLLGKPAILLDYDYIHGQIPQAKKRIAKLKEVYKNLSAKVNNLTEICDKKFKF